MAIKNGPWGYTLKVRGQGIWLPLSLLFALHIGKTAFIRLLHQFMKKLPGRRNVYSAAGQLRFLDLFS